MPASPAASPKQAGPRAPVEPSDSSADAQNKIVRLHITPFNPALLKVYLPPSLLPAAKNISYHAVETFPEKGFGYVELPAMEAQKLKKKLNGSTLKGSKVRIEEAKPEKRKKMEVERALEEAEEEERPAKRVKKDKKKKKKEDGVLEGVELPAERKVKRGWTEVPVKGKKERKEKDKDKDKDKDKKAKRKESKYTKEPEVLFKAKLTPVAATEVARKEKKDKKKEKKEKKRAKASQEVIVHEFEHNTKTPSFIKAAKVSSDAKPAADYVNGKGWVDEDGAVIEPETSKAKKRRVLERVEPGLELSKPLKAEKKEKKEKKDKKEKKKSKKATPPPESSSESEESSVVSSSSESESDSDSESDAEPAPTTPASAPSSTSKAKSSTPEITITSPSATAKPIHPLEALFKRPKPTLGLDAPTSTPAKPLSINTSFSFFDTPDGDADGDIAMTGAEVGSSAPTEPAAPFTPQTQRDIEWRGLRSAAPTPDTAAVGRRFSFAWRGGSNDPSHGSESEDGEPDEEGKTLESNTMANASSGLPLADVAEENEEEDAGEGEDAKAGAETNGEAREESEFQKWFWENQGSLSRGWKRRRREAVKGKRSVENRRAAAGAARKG